MKPEHKTLIDGVDFQWNLMPIIQKRDAFGNQKLNRVCAAEVKLRKKMIQPDKCPGLFHDPAVLLDSTRLAEWTFPKVCPKGELGKPIWKSRKMTYKRVNLILARYWCDLVRVKGDWPKIMYPKDGDNPTFLSEVTHLTDTCDIPGQFTDVLGDGNCAYWCMLDYLCESLYAKTSYPIDLYPLSWMQKKIHDSVHLLPEVYWTWVATTPKCEKLDNIYDECINYMDVAFTTSM